MTENRVRFTLEEKLPIIKSRADNENIKHTKTDVDFTPIIDLLPGNVFLKCSKIVKSVLRS